MSEIKTQLVVLGGGPGGYSAAFRAADLGIETVIVDSRVYRLASLPSIQIKSANTKTALLSN